jgi:hypothetical protein
MAELTERRGSPVAQADRQPNRWWLLPLAGLALPSGRWLDRVGQRPALLFSLAGFALASELFSVTGCRST